MPRALFVLPFFLLWAGTAGADLFLVPETHVVEPGSQINVSLFLPNDSGEERTVELPMRITLRPRGVENAPEIGLLSDHVRREDQQQIII